MIPAIAWHLVASDPPPIPLWARVAAEQARLDYPMARAYWWAHGLLRLMSAEAARLALREGLPAGYRIADISAGFIPFGHDEAAGRRPLFQGLATGKNWVMTPEGPWGFGVVVGVTAADGADDAPLRLPQRLFDPGFGAMLVVEERRVGLDAPPHPAGLASSACYARPRAGKHFHGGFAWREGIVTARHVQMPHAAAAGAPVALATGVVARVADIDSATTIDAAVLDYGMAAIPAGARPLPVPAAIAPGLRVTVDGARTQFQADVLRVMDDPHYFGAMAAHRAFIDAHGAPGDSGALVTGGGTAVGVYIGKTREPAEGIVQLMRQVTAYFDIDLFL